VYALRYALVDERELAEAIAISRAAIPVLEALVAADPQNAYSQRSLGITLTALGRDLLEAGDAAGALATLRRSHAIAESLLVVAPASGEYRHDAAFSLRFRAEARAAAGDPGGALADYRRSLAMTEALVGADSASDRDLDDLAITHAGIGAALVALGDPNAALAALTESVRLATRASLRSPSHVGMQSRLARRHFELGEAHARLARANPDPRAAHPPAHLRAACDEYRRSLDVWNALGRRGVLRRADSERPGAVARALARCEAALRRTDSESAVARGRQMVR
jgi:tetratricopeptide (TPR) repeat protein